MPNKQSLYTLPPDHRLLVLSTGRTATFRTDSADIDSGCSFCLYIPSTHPLSQRARDTPRSRAIDADPSETHLNDQLSKELSATRPVLAFPLLVLVHSSRNDGQMLRDEWSDWAEEHQVVLLSVIFSYRFLDGQVDESWKSLVSRSNGGGLLRYDREILDMVDMVQREWGTVETQRFGIAGFSGGAQAAQRFWLLHPERVSALSLAAPGAVTTLARSPWPSGVDDTVSLFGVTVAPGLLRAAQTVIHCLIGSRDIPARHAVMAKLKEELASAGVQYTEAMVYGAGHEEEPMRDAQQAFFTMHLAVSSAT